MKLPALTIRAALAALQWRLLLLWCACLALPTLLLTLPLWQTLSGALDHSVHAAELAQQLDPGTLRELLALLRTGGVTAAAPAALALTLLLSPLLSGMVVTAARAPAPAHCRELVAGALREYGPMLGMLLWSVVPLGCAMAAGGGALWLASAYAGQAILESEADAARLAATALFALLFMLAHASVDAGRAAMAGDRRHHAVRAWWRGVRLLARRPFACLASYLVLGAAGLLAAALLGLARIRLPHVDTAGAAAAFALGQLIVAALGWMRGARLFALIEISKQQDS